MRLLYIGDFTEQFAYRVLHGIHLYSQDSGEPWVVRRMPPSCPCHGLQLRTGHVRGLPLQSSPYYGHSPVDDRLEDVENAPGDKFLGLFEEYDMSPSLDRGPVLLETTKKAIGMLDNPKGFFLMIEGSQIDDYAHRNKVGQMVEELFDFDKTLGYVLEWAARDGQTLVVVTADHATGGLTLLKGDLEERTVKVHFSTKGHNGIVVPVFAFGPGAQNFAGVHENAEIGQIVRKLLK